MSRPKAIFRMDSDGSDEAPPHEAAAPNEAGLVERWSCLCFFSVFMGVFIGVFFWEVFLGVLDWVG